MTVHQFIWQETFGASCVVDFGCGKGESIASVHPTVKRVVGLEIFDDYLVIFQPGTRASVRQADFNHFEEFVLDDEMDCALFADSLEHVSAADAASLLDRIQDRFQRCLVFTPLGYIPQESGGEWGDANPSQRHLSGFQPEFFTGRGFRVRTDPTYHGAKGGAIFAAWSLTGEPGGLEHD